jgi:hypothetical protein
MGGGVSFTQQQCNLDMCEESGEEVQDGCARRTLHIT